MRLAYFDCFSGASGDMILGALIDAGASTQRLLEQLRPLAAEGLDLTAERVIKQGFAATSVSVTVGADPPHRHLKDIQQLIGQGHFSKHVQKQAIKIFEHLAAAEAQVHGTTIEQVHFHEVGALDAIVDIVGACLALEQLGVEQVQCSAIPPGSGSVRCAHGILPVPAPATAVLLKNIPLAASAEVGELATPTGVAILASLSSGFGPIPAMHINRIGCGAGRRDGQYQPNILRVMIGQADAATPAEQILVLQANIDDLSPEILAHVQQRLLDEGALEVYCQPIYMKKGRIGTLMTTLCVPQLTDVLEAIIFAETTTLGIRRQIMNRSTLHRRLDTVSLHGHTVHIKVGVRGGQVLTASPEFDDCAKLARQTGLPLRRIMAEALEAWKHCAG